MKKMILILTALSAALAFSACQKEKEMDENLIQGGISFHVIQDETKTAFGPKGGDGKYPVVWTDDDTHLAINLNGANGFLDAARVQDEAVRFRISGALPTASSYTFYAVSPFAAAKGVSDAGSKGVCLNVELPASQTTLTTGPDAAAQLLYAVSDTFDEQPSGVDLSFGHIPAYLHLVFVNAALEGQVQSVSVSSDELNLAGRMNFYPKDGSFAADNMVKEVTVATSQLADVWCAVAPANLSGKTLRFDIATTSGHTFKEVTFENGRVLTAGKAILVTFDMGSGSTIVIDGACSFNASFAESIVPAASIPSWSNPSTLNIYGSAGSAQLALASTSGADAVFSGNASMTGPFSAIYSQGGSVSYTDGHLRFVLPAEQTVSGSADPTALAAVAFSSTLDMSFKNVSSLLKVTVEEEGIQKIVVRATDGTALAGTVQVNPVTGAVIGISGGSDSITLLPAGEAFATGDYYISAIPSRDDLDLTVTALRSSDVRKGLVETSKTLVRANAIETASSSSLDWAYRIADNADLRAWAADKDHWNAAGEDVYIVSDINMNDEPWTTLTDSYPGRILGNGHCISHINIQSNTSANVGFFGKGYTKELRDLTFGSEDGLTYDGTSCIINGLVSTSTSAKWNYTGLVTVAAADIVNVTNFVPMTVLASSNRSSRVAGIAGWTTDLVHITGCRNYGTITVEDHAKTDGSDYNYLSAAGILGGLNTETGEAYVNDCHNHGLITSASHCQNAMGGIVGMSYHTVVKLAVTNCTNSGRVELIYTATQNENFCIGGIVGKPTGTAGKEVEIANCTNTGAIYSEAVHQHYVGGIAGYGDGVSITSCRNEGSVAIDHSKAASARFQHVGGILGATMPKYGANNLTGNINTGRVSMKVASSGHNATPKSTTTFYGVNAGGILGCANNVSSLSGNRNEGDVVAENDYKATKTAYPALVHVGGIVGYDFGALEGFSSNTFTGTITAKTTNSESVASEVYAGGIIGRQRAATMLSGAGDGSVTTQAAAAGAVRYAGSIAGYNDGVIAACTYAGTVDGAEATASNTVGGGNAPQSSGEDPVSQTFTVSRTSVAFPGTAYEQTLLQVTTGAKAVTVTMTGLDWLKTASIPAQIAAHATVNIPLSPATGNVCDTREGTLTFTEVGGETKSVALSQSNLYTAVNGYPARWEIEKGVTYTESNAAGQRWINEGVATTVAADDAVSNAPGTAYISGGSLTGNTLNYSVVPSGVQTLAVGNMKADDYIQFSVPVISLPADTDVDFMLTINTNNNKSPKYFLFEYWDNGQWKSQPRYTADEDGTPYSFDIYDFSSKNHRTYITTFRTTQAINSDFIKMRVRAVGSVNCSGAALTPYSSAYVNFPCMTYRACEINAYPGVATKESTPLKLLQLGNSFTYYHGSAFKLKQICRAEGHPTDVRINVKGSQEFYHHLEVLPFSQRLMQEGGYDRAIIQDGSYFHAEYGAGSAEAISGGVTPKYTPAEILDYTQQITALIKQYSSNSQIILESVWSYPYKSYGQYLGFGSFEAFDAMQWKGSTEIMAADSNISTVSPIGKAFALARNNGYTSAYNYLLWTDNYHPSRYGAYLKSCINYLILFGERFGSNPADCDIPHEDAARLRAFAEQIVFGN